VFTPQVDDQESECGLDRVSDWDLVIENNGGAVDELLDKLEEMAKYQQ